MVSLRIYRIYVYLSVEYAFIRMSKCPVCLSVCLLVSAEKGVCPYGRIQNKHVLMYVMKEWESGLHCKNAMLETVKFR
jgi:hypothetical protein